MELFERRCHFRRLRRRSKARSTAAPRGDLPSQIPMDHKPFDDEV
jgi:hypothetical protein